jgi:hypothetical protein
MPFCRTPRLNGNVPNSRSNLQKRVAAAPLPPRYAYKRGIASAPRSAVRLELLPIRDCDLVIRVLMREELRRTRMFILCAIFAASTVRMAAGREDLR